MHCFFKFGCFKRLVLSSVLCSFPLVAITSFSNNNHQININLNDISFGIKLQKLINKAWKYYDKSDSDSLLDIVLEIKSEIESYTGKKIDISKEIDKIECNLKKKIKLTSKSIFKRYKELF